MHAARDTPQQALAVYAESFAAGAQVAVFGQTSRSLGDQLIALGARSVRFLDPQLEPHAQPTGARALASAGIVVQAYDDDRPLERIDLAIVPELGDFSDPAELLARIRALLGDDGVALVAAANAADSTAEPGSTRFDYYELFDLVAAEFDSVRMVAELPFHGVALVTLGEADEAPPVSVDTQLADPDRAPRAFVAVASQIEVALEPYAIVEVGRAAAAEEPPKAHLKEAEAALRMAEEARERADALERRLRDEATRAIELRAALVGRDRQLADLSAEVEELRAAAEAGRIAAGEVEALARRADRAESRVGAVEQEASMLLEGHAAELLRLEAALRDRAQAIRHLEREIARRDRIVRDLVAAVEEGEGGEPAAALIPSAAAPADPRAPTEVLVPAETLRSDEAGRLREQLDALALEVARREGEAQAMTWTVAELERRLAQAERNGASPNATAEHSLAVASEVDALRQALLQEHDARRRAESGEALAAARAQVQQLTVLLQQAARASDSPAHSLVAPLPPLPPLPPPLQPLQPSPPSAPHEESSGK